MIRSYTITLDRPTGVTDKEMREFIDNSIRCMPGSLHPEEPLFDLNRDSIVVKNGPKDGK